MKHVGIYIFTGLIMGLFIVGSSLAEPSSNQAPYGHEEDMKLPRGVIGISLQVGAEHIGDPAVLYVAMAHPEGPAHKAGVQHGDQVVSVDGAAVAGMTYEQIIKRIRGEEGTIVKLGLKTQEGVREISIARVASDKLPSGPAGSHGNQAR